MCLFWNGPALPANMCNWGALAVIQPLLERMDVAGIIDRHLPPDPQLEYSYGKVLQLLLATRLQNPVALVNVAGWAEKSGAEIFYDVPAVKLNDDRLGRALDALFTQRHSILASLAEHTLRTFELPRDRLHYDTTHLLFQGSYDGSQPIDTGLSLPPLTPSQDFPPAHITHGYLDKHKMIHVGVSAVVDELGAVPIYGHILSGNRNGQTGIEHQFHLLQNYLHPDPFLMVSDRGTFSADHVARLGRAGHFVLCSVPWKDYRPLFEQQRAQLHWRTASFLSVEQQRRRDTKSSLPKEHYQLAVLKHQLTDPETKKPIRCRVLFVFSSADQKSQRANRAAAIAKIRRGLEQIQQAVARAHPTTRLDQIPVRVAKLFGKKEAARYFRYELVKLSDAERDALPPPQRGGRPATHRFTFTFDQQAADADTTGDGYYALLTTAPQTYSADTLFTFFKEQNYLESAHHQFKTPLAVTPFFLKTPERVEALAYLMKIALTAYHLIQRVYRQAVADEEKLPRAEKRLTTESILRVFNLCPMQIEKRPLGKMVRVSSLTSRQRQILFRLGFDTPVQNFARRLPKPPPPD